MFALYLKIKKVTCGIFWNKRSVEDGRTLNAKGLVVLNPSSLNHLKNSYKAKLNQQHVAPILVHPTGYDAGVG